MGRSISFCKGTGKHDLMHNTREYIADNVDPARIKYNVVLKRQTLADAYNDCFGQAMADYNAKQKRKDRRIDDYFKHLFRITAENHQQTRNAITNKNGNQSYYENVVQIGDMFDTGSNSQATESAKQALIAYVNGDRRLGIKSYAERNPQFYVFDAVVHMDESTPHLHIAYIPVATGYKNGMAVQNSHDKALKQMGYETNIDYVMQEREVFRTICKAYGLDPRERENEKGRGHTYTGKKYKENAEQIRKADKQIREAVMPSKEPEKPSELPEPVIQHHKSEKHTEAPEKRVEASAIQPTITETFQDEMRRRTKNGMAALMSELELDNVEDNEYDLEV